MNIDIKTLVVAIYEIQRDNYRMPEIYLAEYPDKRSPIAYRAVEGEDGLMPFPDREYAKTIENMIEVTGVEDPEAILMASLYYSGIVTKNDAPYLKNALADIPGENLVHAIRLKECEGIVDPLMTDIFTDVQDEVGGADIQLLTQDGLFAEELDIDGSPFIEVIGETTADDEELDYNIDTRFETVSAAEDFAERLGLDHAVFHKELVWETLPFGEQRPVLLTTRTHIALGYIANTDFIDRGNYSKYMNFVHVVSVLSPMHPARSLKSRLES